MRLMPLFTALLLLPFGLLMITRPAPPLAAQTSPAIAAEPSPAERARIEQIVRDYLLTHPEIIPEAVTALQNRDVERAIASNRDLVETPYPGAVAGNPHGDVTVVEFFDFRCPYCRETNSEVNRLVAQDPNVRLVFRDLPVLDSDGESLSRKAALIALAAANQGRYNEWRNHLFGLAGRLGQERLVDAVRSIGLDEARVARDMADPKLAAVIDGNVELARALGFSGTPTFIIGGRVLSGARTADALQEAVARARRAASPRPSSGAAPRAAPPPAAQKP